MIGCICTKVILAGVCAPAAAMPLHNAASAHVRAVRLRQRAKSMAAVSELARGWSDRSQLPGGIRTLRPEAIMTLHEGYGVAHQEADAAQQHDNGEQRRDLERLIVLHQQHAETGARPAE